MQQLDIIRMLNQTAARDGALVVSDIGSQTQWLYHSGDRESHFYLTGPMGMASSVALGLALSLPNYPVLAIIGDGALAMNLSSLAALSMASPKNLAIALMDNQHYELTGNIPTPSKDVDWLSIIQGFGGFQRIQQIDLQSALTFSNEMGLSFFQAKLLPSNTNPPPFPLTPTLIKSRFQRYLTR